MKSAVQAVQPKNKKNGYLATILSAVFLSVLLGKVIFLYAFVPTDSMSPYIDAGNVVVAGRLKAPDSEYRRGDVIVFAKTELTDTFLVKRIVGLPGETVEILRGTVYIDGIKLDEPYVTFPKDKNMTEVRVPASSYFVLGDNRQRSNDSSDWTDRYVVAEDIKGRVLFVVKG